MTSLMGWRNKYSFLKSTYLDDVDRVLAGDVFQVQYLGYNKISGNAEGTVREILSRYSGKRSRNMASTQEPVVDLMSTALRQDSPDQRTLVLFNIPLSSVKNVIHWKRDKHYGDYCVLIVRDADECCEGVHVMSCGSQNETSRIIQSFQVAFNVGIKH